MASAITSLNGVPFTDKANASSNDSGFSFATNSLIVATKFWNLSFLATKSVSALISTTAAVLPSTKIEVNPSAAIRSDFLAAFDKPFSRK